MSVYTVNYFFDWKVDKKRTPIEDLYPQNEIIMSWERRDVLYSFIGIYQIGLSIYYPNLFYRTDYQIKIKDTHQVFGVDYLIEKENDKCRYQQYNKLNTVLEEKAFISIITEPGNIIPIWCGGNRDWRLWGYCFDIPDLYFGKWPKWFEALCIIYPEAALSKIKNDTYSIGTVEFLKKVSDDKSYKAFIDHIVCIINDRTNQLNCCLVSTTN